MRGGAVEIVDPLTGRIAERRQWPDGLHAAVEAKEGARPSAPAAPLGSITVQHLMRRYPRLRGMTATAASAADEIREIYGLEVVVLPPHRPARRLAELEVGPRGIDWESEGLTGPSATWTYLVSDDVMGGDPMATLAHRPGLGLWGVLLLGPLLFLWGLRLHWARWRARRAAPEA